MNEINSAEKLFLGKLEILLSEFDKIDNIVNEINKMIEDNPEEQRQLDLLLSDYYHMLENEELNDVKMINISKKIHESRLKRRSQNRVASLISCYEKHKEKIRYSVKANREMFRQAIKKTNEHLYEDYSYRVLTEDDIKELSESDKKVAKSGKRKYGKAPTKKELQESIKQGMKNKDISEKFDITLTYVSRLKSKYGLNKGVRK